MTKVPFEKGFPIFGNLFNYTKDRLSWLSKLANKHEDIFKVRVGSKDLYVVTGKQYVREIMFQKSMQYIKKTNFDLIFGKSLFTTNGEDWKKQRQLLIPLMNLKYLENCLPMMEQIVDNNIKDFEFSGSNGKNLRDLFSKITFDIIMSCVIGLDYESDYQDIDKSLAVLTNFVTREKYAVFNLPSCFDKEKKEFDLYSKKLNDLIYGSINDKDRNILSFSFLNQLLEYRKKSIPGDISDEFIRDNIVTVMFAGYETSALSLSFMFDLLLENPEWFEKCSTEVEDFDGEINYINLQKLPIVQACLFESMRLFPAGWGFTREASQADSIQGMSVKKGDIFLISPFLTHRSTKYWDDPLKFDPNRFLDKKITDEIRQIYFPFGAGPRMCSGMNFALMEMNLIILKLLKGYKVERTGARPIVDARATLLSKNGFQMRIIKKDRT